MNIKLHDQLLDLTHEFVFQKIEDGMNEDRDEDSPNQQTRKYVADKFYALIEELRGG